MYKQHEIISTMPIIIVWYWLFCAVFLNGTSFYFKWFPILDAIDSIIVAISGLHFLFFRKLYNFKKTTYVTCMYFIIFLNILFFSINLELYYFLFYFILLTFILASFWNVSKF